MTLEFAKISIDRYVENGTPPGDFLTAVLENNLKSSFALADEESISNLYDIVKYCYNKIPSASWGSEEKVSAWMKYKSIKNR